MMKFIRAGELFPAFFYVCLKSHKHKFLHHSKMCFKQIQAFACTYQPQKKPVHSTKGWKALALAGEKSAFQKIISCEDGKGAVPHNLLMSQLENCSSVSSQIETFCSLLSISPDDVENRKKFCQSLTSVLQLYFPHVKVHPFGSSVNGLGFKGCDVDASIQTLFHNEEYVTLREVPSLDSVLKGDLSPETLSRMTPQYILRFVRRIFRRHCPDIKEPILLIKARCPILRFYNSKYDLFCDFSCVNSFSLSNTKLLRLFCHIDERFAPLAKIIRYWGKFGGFVGDIDRFNSYAFSLLIVHFFQTRKYPVLPPLLSLIEKSEYLLYGDVDDTALLLKEAKKFQIFKNDQTIEELLKEYFFFYLNFDFSRVILPLTSSSTPKSEFMFPLNSSDDFEFSSVSIQDPFRSSFNATSSATYKHCLRFLNSLIQACTSYQNKSLWIPQTELWGICTIFQSPKSESRVYKDWKKSLTHTIELPYKSHAAENLQNILEYGLLFKCSNFILRCEDTLNDSIISKHILKLHCKSYYNTWQGRDLLFKKYDSEVVNHIELEHLISVELSQSKAEDGRQMLFDFYCDCHEIRDSNMKILLTLTFKESKHPPIVAIFLKEFIPNIYNKL